jgi:hypothetical protein
MALLGIAIFLSFLLSFVAGFMSIGYAILRHLPTARVLGWLAIGANVFALMGLIPIFSRLGPFVSSSYLSWHLWSRCVWSLPTL